MAVVRVEDVFIYVFVSNLAVGKCLHASSPHLARR